MAKVLTNKYNGSRRRNVIKVLLIGMFLVHAKSVVASVVEETHQPVPNPPN
jgi:hypothetical protein